MNQYGHRQVLTETFTDYHGLNKYKCGKMSLFDGCPTENYSFPNLCGYSKTGSKYYQNILDHRMATRHMASTNGYIVWLKVLNH